MIDDSNTLNSSCTGPDLPPVPDPLQRELRKIRQLLLIVEELSRDDASVLEVYATALEQTLFPRFVDLLRRLAKGIDSNTQP